MLQLFLSSSLLLLLEKIYKPFQGSIFLYFPSYFGFISQIPYFSSKSLFLHQQITNIRKTRPIKSITDAMIKTMIKKKESFSCQVSFFSVGLFFIAGILLQSQLIIFFYCCSQFRPFEFCIFELLIVKPPIFQLFLSIYPRNIIICFIGHKFYSASRKNYILNKEILVALSISITNRPNVKFSGPYRALLSFAFFNIYINNILNLLIYSALVKLFNYSPPLLFYYTAIKSRFTNRQDSVKHFHPFLKYLRQHTVHLLEKFMHDIHLSLHFQHF